MRTKSFTNDIIEQGTLPPNLFNFGFEISISVDNVYKRHEDVAIDRIIGSKNRNDI